MDRKCIDKVRSAAGGRKISDEKLAALEAELSAQMRELARKDPGWAGKSRDTRLAEAAQAAQAEIQRQAQLKELRGTLQILRTAESENRLQSFMTMKNYTRTQALIQDIMLTEQATQAIRNEAVGSMRDMLDAATSTDGVGVVRRGLMFLFDMENPMMTRDVVREIFSNADGKTGNKAAQAGAKAWLDVIESLRSRFNDAGGDIGKLGYGYLGQAHDAVKIKDVGVDKWVQTILENNLLDRKQYVNADGSIMSNEQMAKMLRAAHETITQGGANKYEPGQFKGAGSRANRGSESRVLHFKDGDAWMAYMKDFGEGSLYDAMLGHIGKMSRDIALVERHGPNIQQWYRVQKDIAERADGVGGSKARMFGSKPDAYWNLATGLTGTPENRVIAMIGNGARNIEVAAKLGGAVISSLTDLGTIAATLHYNRLDYFQMFLNIGRQVTSSQREFLQAHGVIGEHLADSLNRFSGEHLTHGLTGRVANSVMKLSLMNAWTDGLRGAFSATMMQGFSKKLGTAWKDLDAWDRNLMGQKGITEADWNIITKAEATEHGGRKYLTGEGVRNTGMEGAQQAATKWMAFVSDEAQFAVINPDQMTRAIATGNLQAGTLKGEAWRCAAQFKSFPIAMLTRHWKRILETPQGLEGAPMLFGATSDGGKYVNRVALLAALNVTLMGLGAIVLQEKALASGKDPYDITEVKFWARAMAQGGGSGFAGDLLFKDPTENRGNTVEQTAGVILGPVAGSVAGLVGDLGVVNAWEAAKGKETNAGAEALRWASSNTPYTSLWQTRAAYEHWFLHNMQEQLNPGYLGRMQQRAMKDWGQGYWWEPGEAAPYRAPDFERVTGD